jgi:hypothetical protein
VWGYASGRPLRSYVQSISSSEVKPVTPEGTYAFLLSTDGKRAIARNTNDKSYEIFPFEGGAPQPLSVLGEGDEPIQWSEDERTLYVRHGRDAVEISRIDLRNGTKSKVKSIQPSDPAGLLVIDDVQISRDGKQIAYGYVRLTSDLYVVDGLK